MVSESQEKTVRSLIQQHRGFIFDLDGTVYLGDHLIPGADEVIEGLRSHGRKTAFLSNKPIARRAVYAEKLNKLGIPCEINDVINSSLVLARHLHHQHPDAVIYPVAEQPVIDELLDQGLTITDDPEITDIVVVSWDRDFHYDKLEKAYRAVVNGASMVGTNPDRTCPMPDYDLPDAACMIAALEACTEKRVDPIVGKPSEIMLQEVLNLLQLKADDCVMFGDRLETDMVMARRADLTSVLVLSGVTDRSDLETADIQPDIILETIADLLSVLE